VQSVVKEFANQARKRWPRITLIPRIGIPTMKSGIAPAAFR